MGMAMCDRSQLCEPVSQHASEFRACVTDAISSARPIHYRSFKAAEVWSTICLNPFLNPGSPCLVLASLHNQSILWKAMPYEDDQNGKISCRCREQFHQIQERTLLDFDSVER